MIGVRDQSLLFVHSEKRMFAFFEYLADNFLGWFSHVIQPVYVSVVWHNELNLIAILIGVRDQSLAQTNVKNDLSF